MRIQRHSRSGGAASAAILGLLALSVAACGGSAAAVAPQEKATAAPTEAATTNDDLDLTVDATPAPVVTTVHVGKEAWFAGFHVTFGTATAEMKSGRGKVAIEATFENTGEDGARLDATLSLVSAGETAREGFTMDIPSVAGLGKTKGVLAFDVKDTFTFDDAVLTLGLPTNQQAVVPLKGGADSAVSLAPTSLTLAGTGKADTLQLDVKSGELRADTPWKHGQQKAGTLVLTVRYAATFDSGFAGGFAFTGENVALKLPDGSIAGVIQDGQSQSVELIAPNSTKKDLLSRFEVADPAAGTYALLVRNGDATQEIPFTIG